MHILVTGCCGFIGSHLTEKLLVEGYEVTGIDNFDAFYSKEQKLRNLLSLQANSKFTFIETDLREPDFHKSLTNKSFTAVVHLAAKAGVQPSLAASSEYVMANIVATNNLLDFMNSKGIKKFLFTSSSSVYGNNSKVPFSEVDLVNEPISPYAFTKLSCELLNYTYHHLYQIDIINLRLFTVFGPRQRPDLAIHKFVKLIDSGKPIKMYGDGSTSRDYTFVSDTVNGYCGALKYLLENSNVFETVNLGNNKPVTLKILIDTIFREMEKTPDVETVDEQPGDVKITYADITKAQKLFGYNPSTKFEDGIKTFIKWYYDKNR